MQLSVLCWQLKHHRNAELTLSGVQPPDFQPHLPFWRVYFVSCSFSLLFVLNCITPLGFSAIHPPFWCVHLNFKTLPSALADINLIFASIHSYHRYLPHISFSQVLWRRTASEYRSVEQGLTSSFTNIKGLVSSSRHLKGYTYIKAIWGLSFYVIFIHLWAVGSPALRPITGP